MVSVVPPATFPGSLEPWGRFGELVTDLGTSAFETFFGAACSDIFGNDHCAAFVFDRQLRGLPHRLIGSGDSGRSHDASDNRADPTIAWIRRNGLGSTGQLVRRITCDDLAGPEYRAPCVQPAGVREKLVLIAGVEETIIALELSRTAGRGSFRSRDQRTLETLGGLLGRLLHKHLSLLHSQRPSAPSTGAHLAPADCASLIGRMREVFLSDASGLTPREAEVCAAIAIGITGEGIGLTFGISPNTVATHRKRAYAKLGISSQSELFLRHHQVVAHQLELVRTG